MKNTKRVVEQLKSEDLLSNIAVRVGICDKIIGEVYTGNVDSKTLFDMASVTKIMVTTNLVFIAVCENRLSITDKVSKFYDVPDRFSELTVFNLLTHTMGVGHRNLVVEGNNYDNIGEYIISLECNPIGKEVEYSCPAFILLGKILEKIYGKMLDELFEEKVATPLGLYGSVYKPDNLLYNIVNSSCRDGEIGIVHDYNCRFLGGVAGNAGLFSNIEDITVYVNMLLNDGSPLFSKSVLDEACKNYTHNMSEARGLGFAYVDDGYQRTGELFPEGSIGHHGTTGQCVFLNRESGLYVIILSDAAVCTERKYGTVRTDKVDIMREKLHNAIKEDLGI